MKELLIGRAYQNACYRMLPAEYTPRMYSHGSLFRHLPHVGLISRAVLTFLPVLLSA